MILLPYVLTIYDTEKPECSFARAFASFEDVEDYLGIPLTKIKHPEKNIWVAGLNLSHIMVVKVI